VVDAGSALRDVSFDLNTSRAYPGPPYSGGVGQAPPPFILPDCTGIPFNFGGATFQQSRATVLAIFTGNCATCAADARTLQAVAAETGTRGVRVVAVLQEGDAPMEQPDAVFCASWRARAMATHPMLLDVSRTLDTLNLPAQALSGDPGDRRHGDHPRPLGGAGGLGRRRRASYFRRWRLDPRGRRATRVDSRTPAWRKTPSRRCPVAWSEP
jgi:hypothetical protein